MNPSEHFDQSDSMRRKNVARILASLTEREALLVHDAAVMGWVQGMRHHDQTFPGDVNAVTSVVDACLAFPEYYPTLSSPRGDL